MKDELKTLNSNSLIFSKSTAKCEVLGGELTVANTGSNGVRGRSWARSLTNIQLKTNFTAALTTCIFSPDSTADVQRKLIF